MIKICSVDSSALTGVHLFIEAVRIVLPHSVMQCQLCLTVRIAVSLNYVAVLQNIHNNLLYFIKRFDERNDERNSSEAKFYISCYSTQLWQSESTYIDSMFSVTL